MKTNESIHYINEYKNGEYKFLVDRTHDIYINEKELDEKINLFKNKIKKIIEKNITNIINNNEKLKKN